tara:strand:- start:367 stop:1029 length:663 start_codon:yes stop_codon:yes gene_type:complete
MKNKLYKLYTDKPKDFECQIYLEGIPLENTNVRMIVESKDTSLSFGGTVNAKGKCIIPIHALGNKLGEASGGLMRLEVFAGDIFFQPWKSPFIIRGRQFDESINTSVFTESVENSLELNIVKQDIKTLSEKFENILKDKDTKYEESVKKWSTPLLNLDKIKKGEPEKVDNQNTKISGLNEIFNKKYVDVDEDINIEDNKEETYKDIVNKWGAVDDDDFKI